MRSKIFSHFLLFNLLFFSLQLIFILNKSSSFISAVPLPWQVHTELLLTLFIHIGLYCILSFIQSLLLMGVMAHYRHFFTWQQGLIIIWALTVCALVTANIYFFPLSLFSKLFSPPIPRSIVTFLLLLSSGVLTLLCINALLSPFRKSFIIISVALFIVFFAHIPGILQNKKSSEIHKKPNIILIGIDSLSPDNINKENMPHLTRILENSTIFTDTISPLARTYPAWTSILTGLYPKRHHARYNLIAKNMVKSPASIAWDLKRQGYLTVFATDDRRFNSIGKEFGFDKTIGPQFGVNDVILGAFNDFPLSNLLINLPAGYWLFPYNHMNRASYFSYYPQTFNKQLKTQVKRLESKKPLFLIVHFTLPHWPYAWAVSLPAQVKDEYSMEEREQLYKAALKRVDFQLADTVNWLKKQSYLNNSFLMFLSDHGEALYVKGSRPITLEKYQGVKPSPFFDYLKRKTATELDKSAGHGSDLLSPEQYRCLLAFKWYSQGKLINKPAKISTRVSLIDVAPTLYDFMDTAKQRKMDGISLLRQIIYPSAQLPERSFYLESGMLPNQALTQEKARKLGQKLFIVNASGELELKKDQLPYLDEMKLYGIISGDWLLALYPDDKEYITVIQNLSSHQWTDDKDSPFYKKSKAEQLLKQLQNFLLH
ncbi:sulfatase-like hydrolase/transferase [Legionella israelensis]|uniref:Putative Sulfatase n=1 Tax=Legionella israelensis TaxID=454 RepID=A0A0W0VMT6_9GAMM|nr:sulfatase-like hydrolase/transferase [Legionella israelensis]KTD21483.1 putative Sulfatase [Legionella israelensis]QBS10051.1 DUF229 domain-containing protein [Legionella israelensis]SCX78805.1 Arylsulfatase A [Legionella israelensis DSM 19235]STX59635.1 putative Sulfatase [Legionella israelensis]